MEKNKCPYCGAEFFYDYTVCPYCGESLKEDNKQLVSQETFKSNIDEKPCDDWVGKWKSKQLGENYFFSFILVALLASIFAVGVFSIHSIDGGYTLEIVSDLIIGITCLACSFFVVRVLTKKRFAVRKIDGFTVLAAKYGHHNFLVCDNKVLDDQKYFTHRGGSDMHSLQGRLPNGQLLLAEFYPEIRILEIKG